MKPKFYLSVATALIVLLAIPACRKSDKLVETEKYTLSKSAFLSADKTDSLYVNLDIEFPVNTNDTAISHIQRTLEEQLFGPDYIDVPMEEAIILYYKELETEYKLNNEPLMAQIEEERKIDATYGMNLNYEHLLTAHPVAVQKNLLSYSIERYLYMGGAHGINTRLFFNFDLTTGQQVNEKDLFTEGYEQFVPALLVQCLIEQNDNLQLISDLRESDYMIEAIVPNGNFYVTEDGITYIFNPYDIAPYSLGETEIFIAADKIKPYLKPEWQLFTAE